MKEIKHPQRIAGLSIISNTIVVTLKTIVGILSGSVAVLSEAIHSGLDLVASMIAYFSVKISSRPPDRNIRMVTEKWKIYLVHLKHY